MTIIDQRLKKKIRKQRVLESLVDRKDYQQPIETPTLSSVHLWHSVPGKCWCWLGASPFWASTPCGPPNGTKSKGQTLNGRRGYLGWGSILGWGRAAASMRLLGVAPLNWVTQLWAEPSSLSVLCVAEGMVLESGITTPNSCSPLTYCPLSTPTNHWAGQAWPVQLTGHQGLELHREANTSNSLHQPALLP